MNLRDLLRLEALGREAPNNEGHPQVAMSSPRASATFHLQCLLCANAALQRLSGWARSALSRNFHLSQWQLRPQSRQWDIATIVVPAPVIFPLTDPPGEASQQGNPTENSRDPRAA
jgi:hypothetical protein